jgi:hypothetical protein
MAQLVKAAMELQYHKKVVKAVPKQLELMHLQVVRTRLLYKLLYIDLETLLYEHTTICKNCHVYVAMLLV